MECMKVEITSIETLPIGKKVRNIDNLTPLTIYMGKIPVGFNHQDSFSGRMKEQIEEFLIPVLLELQKKEKNYIIVNKCRFRFKLLKCGIFNEGYWIAHIYGMPKNERIYEVDIKK